ncbi:hypothetical protein MYX75_00215 [Acidobacteria bacterium AH-259-A15]|nr:hypothetical protein [Acidobacteria bacterium AH-259-A15]
MLYPSGLEGGHRGTALGDLANLAYKKGYVVREEYPTYSGRGTLSLPGFSLRQIELEAMFFEYNVYKSMDRKRALTGLARAIGRRYPRFYTRVKKVMTKLSIRRYGKGVSVMGSDQKISTRPTAGMSEGIVQGVGHASQ